MTTYWLDKSDKKEDQKVYNGVTKWTNTLQILHKQIRCKQSDLKSTKVIAIAWKKTLIKYLILDVKLRKIKKILWGPMKENQTENKAKKHFLKLGFI